MKHSRINNVNTNLGFFNLEERFLKEESNLLYEFERHSFLLNGIYHVTSGRLEE